MKNLFFLVSLFLLHMIQAVDDQAGVTLIDGSRLHVGVNPNFNSDQVVAGVAPHGDFEWCIAVSSPESAESMQQFFDQEEIELQTYKNKLDSRFCLLTRIADAAKKDSGLAQKIKDRQNAKKEEPVTDEDSFSQEMADAEAVGIDLTHIPKKPFAAMGLLLCGNKCRVFNCEYGIEPSNFMEKSFEFPFLVGLYPEWKPDLFFQLNKKQVSSALKKVAELVNDRRYKEAAEEHFKTSDAPVVCMVDPQQEIEQKLQQKTEVSLMQVSKENACFLMAALLLMQGNKND